MHACARPEPDLCVLALQEDVASCMQKLPRICVTGSLALTESHKVTCAA